MLSISLSLLRLQLNFIFILLILVGFYFFISNLQIKMELCTTNEQTNKQTHNDLALKTNKCKGTRLSMRNKSIKSSAYACGSLVIFVCALFISQSLSLSAPIHLVPSRSILSRISFRFHTFYYSDFSFHFILFYSIYCCIDKCVDLNRS